MQVILLAAGLGSRLGDLTKDIPKALIPVGGEPLLLHALRFAGRLAPSEVLVVGGFGYPQVARTLEANAGALPRKPVRLLENAEFRSGNLVSLMAAAPHLIGEFVLMNIDHIYRPAIAERVALPAEDVTAFIDTDRPLGADDMKVERDASGRVVRISKTLERWDCGYVGMTRVPAARLARYLAEAERALIEEGRSIHVERVLARLADAGEGPATRDISGHGWLEVDTPDERAHAEEALLRGDWR